MVRNLTRNWWTFVLQGVLAIAVGIGTFVVPGVSLAAFITVFAIYAFATGVFQIAAGFSMAGGPKWSLVLGGVASIVLAVLTVYSPGSTAVAVTLFVGIWGIVTGVAQAAAAYMLGSMRNSWLLALSGIVSVVFGVFLIASPGDGVLAVLWLIGYYAIFAGITAIAFGLRLRNVDGDISKLESELTGASSATQETAASH